MHVAHRVWASTDQNVLGVADAAAPSVAGIVPVTEDPVAGSLDAIASTTAVEAVPLENDPLSARNAEPEPISRRASAGTRTRPRNRLFGEDGRAVPKDRWHPPPRRPWPERRPWRDAGFVDEEVGVFNWL
jgi:hypothetical protein